MEYCPHQISDIDNLLNQLSLAWANNKNRPTIRKEVADHWDKLLETWITDRTMPLFVRKFNSTESRGRILTHQTGRKLIPSDNTPAHWTYMAAYTHMCPTINDIRTFIDNREVPVAMALGKEEKKRADYSGLRANIPNPNKFGWKVCHKEEIGLKDKLPFAEILINQLELHFLLFFAPSNMFLVPKQLSGMGEIPQMRAVMRDYL